MKLHTKFIDFINEETNKRVISASELLTQDYAKVLPFTGKWNYIFGNPSPDFSMMVTGEPGSGKTSLLLEFAYYLASNFGKVLYISSEEFGSKTLYDKLKYTLKNNIFKNGEDIVIPNTLFFGKGFADLQDYDFIIVDSVTEMNLDIMEYREIKDIYPNKAFILVLQHTKSGEYRGSKEWEHDLGICASVDNGVIDVFKNRYASKTKYDYFKDKKIISNSEQSKLR